jgi:uncharacterized protein YbaP (TraB family)
MNLRKFSLWGVLFLCSSVFGQNKADNPIIENSLFWRLTDPISGKVSYIFGTIHLIDKDKFFIPKEVNKALTKSELLVFEVNNQLNDKKTVELTMLKEGKMSDLLNQQQKDSLYYYVGSTFGIDSASYEIQLGKFKPMVFTQLPMMKFLSAGKSLDLELMKIGKEKQIPLQGLETYEQQMAIFDNMSKELQVELIMSTVRDTASPEGTWNELQSNYLSQNISTFLDHMQGESGMEKYMMTELIVNRNNAWVKDLNQLFKQQNTFVAVGAAHLAGEAGIIHQLRQLGWKVEAIKINFSE